MNDLKVTSKVLNSKDDFILESNEVDGEFNKTFKTGLEVYYKNNLFQINKEKAIKAKTYGIKQKITGLSINTLSPLKKVRTHLTKEEVIKFRKQ